MLGWAHGGYARFSFGLMQSDADVTLSLCCRMGIWCVAYQTFLDSNWIYSRFIRCISICMIMSVHGRGGYWSIRDTFNYQGPPARTLVVPLCTSIAVVWCTFMFTYPLPVFASCSYFSFPFFPLFLVEFLSSMNETYFLFCLFVKIPLSICRIAVT